MPKNPSFARALQKWQGFRELKFVSGDESEDVNRTKDASITSQVAGLHIPQGSLTRGM